MVLESKAYKDLEKELITDLTVEKQNPEKLYQELSAIYDNKTDAVLQLQAEAKPVKIADREIKRPVKGLLKGLRKSAGGQPDEGWHPVTALGMLVDTAGFDYSFSQDIVYSSLYNYQRLLGYCDLYDKSAIAMMTRIDCEPVLFEYGDYDWRIEFWKGQYGIETGCEVGIYQRKKGEPLSELEKITGPMYTCVPDAWMLPMSLELRKIGAGGSERLFYRKKQNHWWLTAFRWGVFSDPNHLDMDISIDLKNREMADSFCSAMDRLGYGLSRDGNSVDFCFSRPKNTQPDSQKILGPGVQIVNRVITSLFNLFRKEFGIRTNNPNEIWLALKKNGVDLLPGRGGAEEQPKDRSPLGFLKSWIAKRFLSKLFELLGL